MESLKNHKSQCHLLPRCRVRESMLKRTRQTFWPMHAPNERLKRKHSKLDHFVFNSSLTNLEHFKPLKVRQELTRCVHKSSPTLQRHNSNNNSTNICSGIRSSIQKNCPRRATTRFVFLAPLLRKRNQQGALSLILQQKRVHLNTLVPPFKQKLMRSNNQEIGTTLEERL